MNIVYIIEDYSENGGVERIVSMKANTLYNQYHHQVTIISVYQDHRTPQYQLDKHIPLIQLNVPFAKKGKYAAYQLYSRIKTLLLAAWRLNQNINRINPDVIFFTTTLGALLLPLCHTKARKIYESHVARCFNPYHRLFKWMEHKADTIVCLTNDDANEYQHTKNVCVIPNFIYKPKQYVKDYICKKAIAVGRLEKQKGFDRLIDIWAEITKAYPDWHLDIYGEGSQHQALQIQIDTLRLGDKITLCGRGENMMEIYPNYSLHLMSSHYEGQGIVLIEAQSCGLPSVTFNFQYGASDIITNGYNGLIIKQDDKRAFVEALYQLISDSQLREQYGKNARLVGQRYLKECIFDKWQQLLMQG